MKHYSCYDSRRFLAHAHGKYKVWIQLIITIDNVELKLKLMEDVRLHGD